MAEIHIRRHMITHYIGFPERCSAGHAVLLFPFGSTVHKIIHVIYLGTFTKVLLMIWCYRLKAVE